MITESYGGKCPNCGYNRMLLRYGSPSWLQYNACPKCGFAHGSNGIEEFKGKEVWDMIFRAEEKELDKRGLPKSLEGLRKLVETFPEPSKDEPETVFRYERDLVEFVWKEGKQK